MSAEQQDVKRRILTAAKKLFAKYGYDGTSVRQICDEAGANVALVSYHFGGKERVFEAVLREFLPTEKLPEAGQLYERPVEGIVYFIREFMRVRHRDPEIIALICVEVEMQSPRKQALQEVAHPIWRVLRTLLQKGKEAGAFHFDSVDQAFLLVVGTLTIYSKLHYFEPMMEQKTFEPEKQLEETIRFILGGLGVPEPEIRRLIQGVHGL